MIERISNTNKDGTPIWGKRHVEGPGVWVSCAFIVITVWYLAIHSGLGVKGKEKQTVGEVYELFELVCLPFYISFSITPGHIMISDSV